MKHLARTAAVLVFGMASLAGAAISLNSSRSNIYRLTYSTTLVTPAQAAAILADLDKTPGMDEAALKRTLPQILKKNGVDPARVKKTLVRPGDKERKSMSVIILDRPEDEAAAIAVSDEGVPGTKPAKKGSTTKK
jgi:hypothetical protein